MNKVKSKINDKKSQITYQSLNGWNKTLAALHAVQGAAILIFSSARTFPVTSSYLTKDTLASKEAGHPVLTQATHHLYDVNLAYVVALFFFLSAIAHLLMAYWYRDRYEANLKRGVNKIRWIEYSLSASTMIVAIGFLTGISDLATLFSIFALTAVMNLLGLVMETNNPLSRRGPVNWLPYWLGAFAGIVPWLAIALYLKSSILYGSGNIPSFVYWIYGTIFVAFSSFAVNMYLQYAKKGRWHNYLYGERGYMILSLVAKSLLAWQVFAGTLRP